MNNKIFSVFVVFTLWVIFDGAKPIQSKKCEYRFMQHYEVKGCFPVIRSDTRCPERFNCPEKAPEVNNNECVLKGRSYKPGETVDVGKPCRKCSCRKFGAGVDISCISVHCPRKPASDKCRDVYEEGKCCPTRKCLEDREVAEKVADAAETKKICNYDGKIYNYGQKIDIKEDPCSTCLCNEQWSGISGKSCKKFDCLLELKRKQINRGCIPIYFETSCCPIEFYCGTPEEGFKNTTVPIVTKEEKESGNFCTFKGSDYGLGQVLDINHPTHCVTCTCTTPPDFTCVQRKCPDPPKHYNSKSCKRNYKKGECCPTYECVL